VGPQIIIIIIIIGAYFVGAMGATAPRTIGLVGAAHPAELASIVTSKHSRLAF